jgi:hypothetical protein
MVKRALHGPRARVFRCFLGSRLETTNGSGPRGRRARQRGLVAERSDAQVLRLLGTGTQPNTHGVGCVSLGGAAGINEPLA